MEIPQSSVLLAVANVHLHSLPTVVATTTSQQPTFALLVARLPYGDAPSYSA
jgi:hypothetical protein